MKCGDCGYVTDSKTDLSEHQQKYHPRLSEAQWLAQIAHDVNVIKGLLIAYAFIMVAATVLILANTS